MPIWTPPGFLTIDEMFSRVGLEMFPSQWTGHELLAGRVQPPEYWRDQELGRRAEAAERKAQSERAQKAAVSIGGNRWIESSRRFSTPESREPIPDWRSETYAIKYDEDKKAADRYQQVAKQIIEFGWRGEYLLHWLEPSGEFFAIEKVTIQSEAFQDMIFNPGTPGRERIYFIHHHEAASATQRVLPPNQAPRSQNPPGQSPEKRPRLEKGYCRQLPARPDGVPNSSWESFCEAWRLRPCFPEKRGSISEAARAVAKEKGSDEGTVLRNLFRALKALKQEKNL
jgi:hypothetical protein